MRRVSPTSAAWLGLLICVLLTGLAWQLAQRYEALERGARFRLESEAVRRAIAFRMQVYVTALEQARGLFAARREVTRDEFRAYVRNMDLEARYPGIAGVGFAARTAPDRRAALERSVRAEGIADFHVWPDKPGDAYVLRFLEPLDERNRGALGYDLSSDPARREAMEQAARTGNAVATGVITIVQDRNEAQPGPGFSVFVPVYRAAELIGFMYASFRACDLFRGISSEDPSAVGSIGYQVFEGERTEPRALLHASGPAPAAAEHERLARMQVAGRTWTLRLFATPAFYRAHEARTPLAVLLVGAVVSALVFYVLLANQRHAMQLSRLLAQEQAASAAAQQAVRTRDDVLAVVSHDLRNPVSSILLNARMLLSRQGSLDDALVRGLSAIQRAADGMRLLIGDLVDLVRIDTGRLSVEAKPEPAGELVRNAVELLSPLAEARGIAVSTFLPPESLRVLCDKDRILQVFSNLIGNAVKFTPPGGSIVVRCEDAGDGARFIVADTGRGLSAEERAHVFDRFWRGDESARGGTGLGLFIVKAIVTAHGGEVSVAGVPAQGATFSFTLPKAP